MIIPIIVPLVNPNESEARVVRVHVHRGMQVKKGDGLCTLETTKATIELTSEHDGYCVGINVNEGDVVQAGEIFGYIVDDLEEWQENHAANEQPSLNNKETQEKEFNLRITKPALALAMENGIDLTSLPKDILITKEYIQNQLVKQQQISTLSITEKEIKDNSLVIVGGGGHGKAVIELVRAMGEYHIIGVLDDGLNIGEEVLGVPVLGGVSLLLSLRQIGLRFAANAVGGISRMQTRKEIFDKIAAAGLSCPKLIHPRAFIEPSAVIADGVQVFPLAYVGSSAKVGFGCIINTSAVVSHDCVLEDMVNLSPNATLAGDVHVGELTLIGMGATVNLKVHIGKRAKIGNGATVKADVAAGGLVKAGEVYPS